MLQVSTGCDSWFQFNKGTHLILNTCKQLLPPHSNNYYSSNTLNVCSQKLFKCHYQGFTIGFQGVRRFLMTYTLYCSLMSHT